MSRMTDERYGRLTLEARRLGAEDGKNAGAWFFDGNTPDEAYPRVLAGLDEGDPEILDQLPYLDLSGQWADGPTPAGILEEIGYEPAEDDPEDTAAEETDELVNEYEEAYNAAMLAEVERACRAQVAP